MIASLNGEILELGEDHIVVGVGGVGLRVYIPSPLRDRLQTGEDVFLHTHLIVRQDALVLYGFETKEVEQFFALLLGVNGIGPRLALSILSVLSTDAIRRAVVNEQAEVFGRVPGVGKKTAQKILLHLQGKIGAEVGLESGAIITDVDTEVLAALTALGYSVVEAQAALQAIPRDTPQDIEMRLRLALQYFAT